MSSARYCMFPQQAFIKVCPSDALRRLLIRSYAERGWQRFVTFKDVNGWGVMAAITHYGPDFVPNFPA